MSTKQSFVPEEQLRYARLLAWGARSGLAILVVTFLAYVFGVLPASVPLAEMPNLWNLPADQFLARTGNPTGWGWMARIGEGDFAGLFGIAWLSGCSLLCLVAVMPIYARRGERLFVAICCVALLVQLLAASGILASGH